MTIVGFDEAVTHIGNFVRLRAKEDISSFNRYEEITADDGMTAIIQEINTNQRIMKIMPTNGTYVSIGETITGTDSSATATVMTCEATAIENYELRARSFIENYTGKLYGSTEQKTEKFTTDDIEQDVWWVSKRPLVSVDSVILDDSTLTEDDDYWVNLERGEINFYAPVITRTYPRLAGANEPYNLEIQYTHGETNVPEVVQQAAILYINHFWEQRNMNATMKGASSLSFGNRSIGNTRENKFSIKMKEIKEILKPLAKIKFDSF